jgi:hypothetical protein
MKQQPQDSGHDMYKDLRNALIIIIALIFITGFVCAKTCR